jgi:hypothetical protein
MLPTHCPTRGGEEATTTMTIMGEDGGKKNNVIKLVAVLDKSDKGRSGVNNNVPMMV